MADLPQNDAQGAEGIEKNSQYLEEPGWAAFPERHPFHTDYIILKNDNTEGPNTLLYREFVTNSLEETQHEIAKIKLRHPTDWDTLDNMLDYYCMKVSDSQYQIGIYYVFPNPTLHDYMAICKANGNMINHFELTIIAYNMMQALGQLQH